MKRDPKNVTFIDESLLARFAQLPHDSERMRVTSSAGRVAIVGPSSAELASALRRAGFDVHECSELAVPTAFADLILLGETEAIVACARRWLRITRHQRIVIVIDEPAALGPLLAIHADRLVALRAPTTAWKVLDVLCDAVTVGPEFAP